VADDLGGAKEALRDFSEKMKSESPNLAQLSSHIAETAQTVIELQEGFKLLTGAVKEEAKSLMAMSAADNGNAKAMHDAVKMQMELGAAGAKVTQELSKAASSVTSFEQKVAAGAMALDMLRTATVTTGEELSRHMATAVGQAAFVAKTALSGMGAAAAMAGSGLMLASGVLTIFVEALDAATKAQRGAVNSLLQSGATTSSLSRSDINLVSDAAGHLGYVA
jgi:hypothetical protein